MIALLFSTPCEMTVFFAAAFFTGAAVGCGELVVELCAGLALSLFFVTVRSEWCDVFVFFVPPHASIGVITSATAMRNEKEAFIR